MCDIQIKPKFCPHKDCICLSHRQSICVGRLLSPIPHDEVLNTHGVCLEHGDKDGEVLDLQVNWGDLWQFVLFINVIARDTGHAPFIMESVK